jgi:hypothetical protein
VLGDLPECCVGRQDRNMESGIVNRVLARRTSNKDRICHTGRIAHRVNSLLCAE